MDSPLAPLSKRGEWIGERAALRNEKGDSPPAPLSKRGEWIGERAALAQIKKGTHPRPLPVKEGGRMGWGGLCSPPEQVIGRPKGSTLA